VASETPVTIRMPADLLAQADELVDALKADPTLAAVTGGRMSRSAVLRLAVVRGLEALKAQYGPLLLAADGGATPYDPGGRDG